MKQNQRENDTYKGCSRKVSACARSTQFAQGQYKAGEANPVTQEAYYSGAQQQVNRRGSSAYHQTRHEIDCSSAKTFKHRDLSRIGRRDFSSEVVVDGPTKTGTDDRQRSP